MPPLYQTVRDTIVERITSGALAPGAMLPSEQELGAELGVSQGTARKALSELESRGILERQQGRGTFVTVRTPEAALFHFFRLRNRDGSPATPELESETLVKRRSRAVEKSCLYGAPAQVFEINRVRSLAGRRVIHESSSVPTELFPGLIERAPLPNALYALFQQAYACVIIAADEKIRAGVASAEIAEALALSEGTPVLEVERIAKDLSDRPVERRVSTYVTEAHRYTISLT